jgi:hypothetical protein
LGEGLRQSQQKLFLGALVKEKRGAERRGEERRGEERRGE